jgi:hypothetical protein
MSKIYTTPNALTKGCVAYWLCGQRQAKGLLKRPSAKRAGELLNLSRDQLRIMMGLLTGHCLFKGRLFKLGLVDSLGCELKVWGCWILKQMVAQKKGNGRGSRVPALPFLIYSVVFYLRQIK